AIDDPLGRGDGHGNAGSLAKEAVLLDQLLVRGLEGALKVPVVPGEVQGPVGDVGRGDGVGFGQRHQHLPCPAAGGGWRQSVYGFTWKPARVISAGDRRKGFWAGSSWARNARSSSGVCSGWKSKAGSRASRGTGVPRGSGTSIPGYRVPRRMSVGFSQALN